MTKLTKQEFCKMYPQYKSLRRKDPEQFKEIYYKWYRYVIADRWSTNDYLRRKGIIY
jgi:hypothetical protein